MRLRRYYWPERLAIYFLCLTFLMFSFPRPARAFVPLLALAVPAGTAAFSEVTGVVVAFIASRAVATAGQAALTATVIALGRQMDQSTPSDLGNNLRASDRVPAVGAALVAAGTVQPSAFNVETYSGKVVNVTSPAQLAALSPKVSGADALYGAPSYINPVPVLIPPLSPDYYPSVPTGAAMSPVPDGVYNISSSGFDSSFNPDNYRYATARNVDDLLDLYIAGHAGSIKFSYDDSVRDYNYFIDACERCAKGGVSQGDFIRDVYTVISLDEFYFPDVVKSVSDSEARGRYNINGSIVSLPVLSSIIVSIPPVIFNNKYKLERFQLNNQGEYTLVSSKILNRHQETRGYSIMQIEVSPNSSLGEKENDKGKGAVIIPPLHTQPDIINRLQGQTLSSAQIASFINSSWQKASSKVDYKGIPYSSAVAVSAAVVNEVLDARNMSITMADLLAPVSTTGYWDIPIYNITLNQYVSNTYIEQVPEIDLGGDPNIKAPVLPVPSPIDVILAPITNILPFMHEINLRSRIAQCPVYEMNIEYFNKSYILDEHCKILNGIAPLISLFFNIAWTMLSLFIVIRRRG